MNAADSYPGGLVGQSVKTASIKSSGVDSLVGRASATRAEQKPGVSSEGSWNRFTLIGDYFPILVAVSPTQYSDDTVQQMSEAFESYFSRNERYVVITLSPKDAEPPDAKQRRLVTAWINSPRAMNQAARLCLGSANIVPNALQRGLHTALLWAWSPPFPMKPVASPRQALEYSIERLESGRVPLPPAVAARLVSLESRLVEIIGSSS